MVRRKSNQKGVTKEMKFTKYSSIENSYRDKEVEWFREATHTDNYIITEKIHGANFSFLCDGKEVKCGKRSGIISEGENFYNYQVVYDKYKDAVMKCFEQIKYQFVSTPIEQIQIFGEIFGGSYPNMKSDVKQVQAGIYYTPNIEFAAFDISVIYRNSENIEQQTFLSWASVDNFLEDCNIPAVPIIGIGDDLDKILAMDPNGVQSKVPEMFGLPEIENNEIEGYVITPTHHRTMINGSRAILKTKTKKFLEKKARTSVKVSEPLPENLQVFVDSACQCITQTRYDNVVSKIGVSPKDDVKIIGKFIGLFNKDVIEDFMKDNPDFAELDKSDRKKVTNIINSESAKFIKSIVFARNV